MISVDVIAWLNWTVPVTLWESPLALPRVTLPSTCSVPSAYVLPVEESTVNLSVLILKLSVKSKSPVTSRFPPMLVLVPTSRFAPTYRLRPIPAPPPTIKVPVDEVDESVVSNSFMLPASRPDLVPENDSEELVAAW